MMNKKLEELLKESGLTAYYAAQEGQIEKFAELVFLECERALVNSIPNSEIENMYDAGYYSGIAEAYSIIKNRFGEK